MTDQLEIDFTVDPVRERWDRLMAIHWAEATEENLCLAWVTESDGRAWRDWWPAQPSYERARMLNLYRIERQTADFHGRGMVPYAAVLKEQQRYALSAAELRQDQERTERWAAEIRQAAIERRPMPFAESEDMTPWEKSCFHSRLQSACLLAGIVTIEARPEEPKKKRQRN